jgi:hypothetical protein
VPVSVTLSHTQSYTDTLKSKSGLNHTKISEKSLKNLTEKSQSRSLASLASFFLFSTCKVKWHAYIHFFRAYVFMPIFSSILMPVYVFYPATANAHTAPASPEII